MKSKCLCSSYGSTQLAPALGYATVKSQKAGTLQLALIQNIYQSSCTDQKAGQNDIQRVGLYGSCN